MLHIGLHFLVPLAIAWTCYRATWRRSYLILLAGLLIDLDHLLADPIYVEERCSIGFHALHGLPAGALYVVALLHPKTRTLGIGLCVHLLLDALDCYAHAGVWFSH